MEQQLIIIDCPICLHEIEVAVGAEVVECPHCDCVVGVVEDESIAQEELVA
jgi:hypothetical protein